MKAEIRYRLDRIPHPWHDDKRSAGVEAMCLIKRTVPAAGPVQEEPVAIFNFDSEAMTFIGHLVSEGLDGRLIDVDPELAETYRRRAKAPAKPPPAGLDLAALRRRAHVHTDACYGSYEPCGEHHAHSVPPDPPNRWCGNRPLICGMREDRDLAVLIAAYDRLLGR